MIESLEELERVRHNCQALVRRRARVAAALAAVPVPGVDLAGDLALLLEVIPAINRRFGLTPEQIESLENPTKVVIYRVIRKVGARFVGQMVTADLIISGISTFGVSLAAEAVAKYVPFAGTVVSGVLAYAIFTRIAYSHIEECVRVTRQVIERETA